MFGRARRTLAVNCSPADSIQPDSREGTLIVSSASAFFFFVVFSSLSVFVFVLFFIV